MGPAPKELTYGEFYNYGEYRKDLEKAGHRFKSNSDTETILHLYEQYGIEETLKRINGMFAFGLWDKKRNVMILARDRVGKKPLHYTMCPDGSMVFASEMKAIFAANVVDKAKIDLSAFVQFWTYGYETGDLTIYEQVKRVPPGHYAVWSGGRLDVKEYWDCPFGVNDNQNTNIDNLADELEALLCDSIRLRLISDVPVGLFLSGGIDSSLISALTAKLTGGKITAFTIAFENERFNEAPYAQAIAKHIGLKNVVLHVTEDMRSYFKKIAVQFDEPFGDSSSIPTYFVAKLAREHVAVVLTGDAGDELFAGYNAYAKALQLWGNKEQRRLFGRRIDWRNKIMDIPLRFLTKPSKRLTDLERIMSQRKMCQILSDDLWSALEGRDIYKTREQWYPRVSDADFLSQMQYVNLKTYLPDDILVKVDRMSMAHALECRCPLLDYRIIEFASRLPYAAKIDSKGRQKYLLRKILARYVPERLTERPKMGFSVPWAEWCRGEAGASLRDRWRTSSFPLLKPESANLIFPIDKLGWDNWQWNAFCTLTYFGDR